MRNPPILAIEESDVAAEAQAAQTRHHASELVRRHLENHASLNPGASSDYVTWLATLHPENAEITIDQRFFVPGNPWWTIYEDTKHNGVLPTATAVPVFQDRESEGEVVQQHINGRTGHKSSDHPDSSSTGADSHTHPPPFYLVCSPISIFAGVLVGFHALLGTLLCEFLALFLCHFPAAVFWKSAQACSPPSICTGVPYSLCMLIYYAFALCDSIVLLTSVMVVEVLAIVGYLVELVTGGVIMATFWHQYIRRSCHGIRVKFRQLSGQDPSRHVVLLCCTPHAQSVNQQSMNQRDLMEDVVPVAAVDLTLPASLSYD